MALTSLRRSNVLNARWEQIDFKTSTMTIAKEEMKLKKKELQKANDFVLPLATQTIELLEKIKEVSGEGIYIFPSMRADRPMSKNTMLELVRYLGYEKEQFTPHGFRAMFATMANEQSDFERDLVDAQLAHKVGDRTSQAYNRTDYLERRRDLVQWWADWLDAL